MIIKCIPKQNVHKTEDLRSQIQSNYLITKESKTAEDKDDPFTDESESEAELEEALKRSLSSQKLLKTNKQVLMKGEVI